MELLLGVVIGVLVSFLALYLTRKLQMAEEEMVRDAQRDAHNDQVLLEVVEQVRALQQMHIHEPWHRSRYVDGSI